MKAVGIKRLKARLSEYVRLAKGGETVLVMERDEVVAELRPARQHELAGTPVEDVLSVLAEAGDLSLPTLPKRNWRWNTRSLGLKPGTARRVLDELRSERD
ncbi:MAG: hypothetical protein K1X64_11820 [Myxococcaceae bacterium]|nr:hypothetical protein [Myxococcaceae bacterium]